MIASTTRPPIANTSLQALAAAIAPKSDGSSTSGGKKSVVDTSADVVADPVDGGVVERGQADEQRRIGRARELGDQVREQRGAPLRGAAAARRPLRQAQLVERIGVIAAIGRCQRSTVTGPPPHRCERRGASRGAASNGLRGRETQ